MHGRLFILAGVYGGMCTTITSSAHAAEVQSIYEWPDGSGYYWEVRSGNASPPGNDPWCADGVHFDKNGIHLRTQQKNDGVWCAAETRLNQTLGYGAYHFCIKGDLKAFDRSTVFGAFLYIDDSRLVGKVLKEADIEITAAWTDGVITGQNSVYRDAAADPTEFRFRLPLKQLETCHTITWLPDSVSFESWRGVDTVPSTKTRISRWEYTDIQPSDTPEPQPLQWFFDLWYDEMYEPKKENEILITRFEFTPQ